MTEQRILYLGLPDPPAGYFWELNFRKVIPMLELRRKVLFWTVLVDSTSIGVRRPAKHMASKMLAELAERNN